jgi:hypothetical protein
MGDERTGDWLTVERDESRQRIAPKRITGAASMHPILGLLMLLGIGAFVTFAFRKGLRVRPDDRPDRSGAYGTDSLGGSHHDGGSGHG